MTAQTRTSLALAAALGAILWGLELRAHARAHAQAAIPVTGCIEAAIPAAAQAAPRGISNFGQVTPFLMRGGQPTTEGYRELKQMGIDTVVSFRHEKGENSMERRAVEAQGMRFVSLPWNAWDKPTDAEVSQFFALLAANRRGKIFVHCQQGRDRTGVMIALYRIAADHWCAASAVSEMKSYHYHHFWFPQLQTYVENFPQRLATDQGLAAAVGSPAPSPH
ncbi:MAG TPA: tyrosine-protein phosphatase [Patescibacteria group bacterium]|nr:tyrosine-protein phosphatase [Patescibacteria group bacterium]